ncbi:MAG: tetratricopeptide repeat protein [Burkholderiales bacterium]|nr:MAG: tetratricopeptide repeat protein [Burkholderiales bacterium]
MPKAPARAAPTVADRGAPVPAPTRSVGTQPPDASAERSYRQGLTHYGAGRIDDALTAFEAALALDPRHAGATKATAAILVERGHLAGAQRILHAALELDPRQAELAALAARIAQRQGDPARALRLLERAVHDSAPAALYAAIAATLGAMHRDAQAIPHWLEALKRTPDRAPWWVGLGVAFESAGRQADAAAAYDRALTLPALPAEAAQFARERLLALR